MWKRNNRQVIENIPVLLSYCSSLLQSCSLLLCSQPLSQAATRFSSKKPCWKTLLKNLILHALFSFPKSSPRLAFFPPSSTFPARFFLPLQPITSFTAHDSLLYHLFRRSPHLNYHHGKVVVSLAHVPCM